MANAYQLISIEQVDGLAAALETASNTPAAILASLLTVDGPGSGLNADLLDGYNSTDFVFTSAYTAADVLAKLITVDGTGSGLDADLFDGYNSDAFPRKAENATIAGSWTFSTGYIHGIGTTARLDLDDNFGASLVYGTSRLAVGGPMIYYIGGVEKLRINLNDVIFASGTITANGNSIWHAGNDGAGSTLDADLLDGQQGSYYQNAGNLNAGTILAARMPALTGDITTSAGAVATTLATVNGNVGSFGSATAASVFTVNAKGLITAASSTTITPAFSSITSTPTTLSGYGITDAMGLAGGTFTGNISIVKASPTITINDTTYSAPSTIGLFRAYSAAGNLYFTRNTSTARDYATESNMLVFNGSSGVASFTTGPFVGSDQIWHAGNDGAGSTLDADLLDAQQGSYYRDAGNLNAGTILAARMPAHTGDVTSSAASVALTLATVNGNVGSFGSATAASTFTVNAKGLITAAGSTTITPAWGSITSVPAGVTSLAALTGAGVVTATSTGVLAMRSIGVAGSTEIPDRAAADGRYLMLAGGTLSGYLVLHADPASAMQAATKQYVDTVASGLSPKAAVRVSTTVAGGNITLSGTQTIDGVAVIAGNRVLVKNQTSALENGIYVCAAGAWARSADADTWTELVSAFVFVEEGTDNADTGWTCTVNSGGTLNTTAVTWVQFSGSATFTASTGITKVGSDFQLTGQALALHNLATNGSIHRTGSGTYASRTLTAPVAGITVTNGDGVAGNPTLVLANDLAAVEGLATTGIVRRTATDTWSASALVNADLPASGVTASTYRSVTVNAQGIVTGGTNPTTIAGYGITDLLTSILAIDGATSGIDADLLDGQHGSYYQDAGNLNAGTILAARMPAHTGDVTSSAGAVALTLATVNGNVGSFGSATAATIFTVNAKGLITAASSATITPAFSSITSKPTTLSGYGITDALGLAGGTLTGTLVLPAGTTVLAPMRFQAGAVQTTPVAHSLEWDGTNLFATQATGPTRKTVAYTDSNITGSAATLTTGRTIAITGDLAWTSPSFNGSGNITAAGTLATVNGNVGSFGSATAAAIFTVNAKGLITAASSATITPAFSSITSKPTTLSGYGITDAVDLTTNQSIAGTKTFSNNLIVSTTTNSTVQQWQGAGTNFNLILSSGDGATASTRSYRIALDYLSGTATNGYIDFFRGTDGTTGFLTFGTSGSERVRIDASGNVGIGITAPTHKLHVRSEGDARVYVEDDNVNGRGGYLRSVTGGAVTLGTTSGVRDLVFAPDNTERMRILTTGYVGIGTASPGSVLELFNAAIFNARTSGLNVHRPSSYGQYGSMAYDGDTTYFSSTYTGGGAGVYGAFRFWAYDSTSTPVDRFRIASNGDVCFGSTAPSQKFGVDVSREQVFGVDTLGYVTMPHADASGFSALKAASGRGLKLMSGSTSLVSLPGSLASTLVLGYAALQIGDTSGSGTPIRLFSIGASDLVLRGGDGDVSRTADVIITVKNDIEVARFADTGVVSFANTSVTAAGNAMWHAGNDGAGSTLDADLLDGQQGAYYFPVSGGNFTGNISIVKASPSITINDTTYVDPSPLGLFRIYSAAGNMYITRNTSTTRDYSTESSMVSISSSTGVWNFTSTPLVSGGSLALLASPAFTGTPTAPTAAAATNTTQIATTAFVTTADNLKANLASPALTGTPTAPTAAAATNTTQIATTAFVTTADNLKANLASPTFTGVPAAPTAAALTNTTQLATTAFVTTAGNLKANIAAPSFTGNGVITSSSGGTATITFTISDTHTATQSTTVPWAAYDFTSADLSGVGAGIRCRIGALSEAASGANTKISFYTAPTTAGTLVEQMSIGSQGPITFTSSTVTAAGNAVWHAGNDGAASGLDADLLDGVQGASYALLASPALTGTPTAPTAAAATNTTQIATTAFVTTADNLKANLASPTFTGVPAAPTAAAATNTTQIATTAFVTTADNLKANLASPTFTGTVTMPAFSVTSDQKLKTSIEPLQGYGEFLDATKIYSFFKDGKHQFGVLAHEAQEVRPELVSTVPHDELGEVMTVNPMDYLFALVAEVQDLRKRVALLEGK